jgi:hypothetical protein
MVNKIVRLLILFAFSDLVLAANVTSTSSIEALAGNKPQLSVHAIGDQIYACSLDSGTYSWKWQAPDAKLFDPQNQQLVGSHGAGPIWEYMDGSSVTAKMTQKVDSPDKSAVPWLLMEVTEHKGSGLLGKTGYILRINTRGGMAPTTGCDDNHLGAKTRVPYSADYNFYNQ